MLDGVPLARVLHRRAYVLGHLLARFEESAADLRKARELFSGSGDQVWEARVLNLQALVDVRRGEVESAAEAFARFGEISAAARRPGLGRGRRAQHRVAGLPAAATCPERSSSTPQLRRVFDVSGMTNVDLVLDQVAAYLSGGLAQDALAVVEAALVARPLQPREEADLLVAVAGAALAADDWDRAASAADEGSSLLRAQSRHVHRMEADLLSITARDRAGEPPAPLLRRAAARRRRGCARRGRPSCRRPSSSVQVWRAGSGPARAAGLASDWLAEAADYRRASTGSERALGWLAQARARELAGDSGGVLRACELGLRALDEQQATLGSQELRAGSAGHGAALAELGTRTAMAGGDARQLLRWSERWRATALSTPLRSGRHDTETAADLAALRAQRQRLDEARSEGAPTDRARGACDAARAAGAPPPVAGARIRRGCGGPRRQRRSSRRLPRTTRSSSS